MGLIGPNGAGKSTFVDAISGFLPQHGGRVLLGDHDLAGLSPTRRARLGLRRTFQQDRVPRPSPWVRTCASWHGVASPPRTSRRCWRSSAARPPGRDCRASMSGRAVWSRWPPTSRHVLAC
nr:ATP-binding cassette domain-containing protein [Microbacterium sp. Se63.02b]